MVIATLLPKTESDPEAFRANEGVPVIVPDVWMDSGPMENSEPSPENPLSVPVNEKLSSVTSPASVAVSPKISMPPEKQRINVLLFAGHVAFGFNNAWFMAICTLTSCRVTMSAKLKVPIVNDAAKPSVGVIEIAACTSTCTPKRAPSKAKVNPGGSEKVPIWQPFGARYISAYVAVNAPPAIETTLAPGVAFEIEIPMQGLASEILSATLIMSPEFNPSSVQNDPVNVASAWNPRSGNGIGGVKLTPMAMLNS